MDKKQVTQSIKWSEDEMKLHYTQEKPTKAGWYWIRKIGYTEGVPIKIFLNGESLYFYFYRELFGMKTAKGLEFSDRPIPECE